MSLHNPPPSILSHPKVGKGHFDKALESQFGHQNQHNQDQMGAMGAGTDEYFDPAPKLNTEPKSEQEVTYPRHVHSAHHKGDHKQVHSVEEHEEAITSGDWLDDPLENRKVEV